MFFEKKVLPFMCLKLPVHGYVPKSILVSIARQLTTLKTSVKFTNSVDFDQNALVQQFDHSLCSICFSKLFQQIFEYLWLVGAGGGWTLSVLSLVQLSISC